MTIITTPTDPAMDELCGRLAERAAQVDRSGQWPEEQLRLCGDFGVYQWFLPQEVGGQGWSDVDIVRGYLRLSAVCLTTTFIITQLTGACRRIAAWGDAAMQTELLPALLAGDAFATLGISHLTTSRRHLARPVLRGEQVGEDFVLDGFSPWVTGGLHAQHIVTGATMDDGRQVLLVLPTDLPGTRAEPPAELVGLTASHTGPVRCDRVRVPGRWLLAGPAENVMASAKGAMTGGLQTSTLAVGAAVAAIDYIEQEARQRPELLLPAGGLRSEQQEVQNDLLAAAVGEPVCSTEQLRIRVNSLVLRASQAAMAAAKGAGYISGHPAGRWCREALFFLVWSCPQPVMAANLCELAGLSD